VKRGRIDGFPFISIVPENGSNSRNNMKALKCDLCEVTAEGETFEEWMKELQPHYREAHADVMNDPRHGTEDMEKWMAENRARFEAA